MPGAFRKNSSAHGRQALLFCLWRKSGFIRGIFLWIAVMSRETSGNCAGLCGRKTSGSAAHRPGRLTPTAYAGPGQLRALAPLAARGNGIGRRPREQPPHPPWRGRHGCQPRDRARLFCVRSISTDWWPVFTSRASIQQASRACGTAPRSAKRGCGSRMGPPRCRKRGRAPSRTRGIRSSGGSRAGTPKSAVRRRTALCRSLGPRVWAG